MSAPLTDLDWPSTDVAGAGDEYVKYADVYDALFGDLSDDTDFYIRCADSHLGAGGTVLELGTGTGRVAAHFLRAGYCVVGVDASDAMLAHATKNLASYGANFECARADIRALNLGRRFRLAVAPYGMMAHVLTDDDRRAAFRGVFEHLEPGGVFIFDDMPGWLSGHSDGTRLDIRRTGFDAKAGLPVRMMSNCIEVFGKPLSVRYDFIDWMKEDEVARRVVIRVIFRDVKLIDELRLLKEAGFAEVDLLGDFDGRPFDPDQISKNTRLIVRARRAGQLPRL